MNGLIATFTRSVLLLTILILTWSGYAADLSPLGLWKTVDDNTGRPRGLVRISEVNGQYEAKLKEFSPNRARSRIQIARNAKVAGVINR